MYAPSHSDVTDDVCILNFVVVKIALAQIDIPHVLVMNCESALIMLDNHFANSQIQIL